MRISLIYFFFFSFFSEAQNNPWLNTGETPWGTIAPNESGITPSKDNTERVLETERNILYGENHYQDPMSLVKPLIITAIPLVGIITIPFFPLFTFAPLPPAANKINIKENKVIAEYKIKHPEAQEQEIRAVKKGMKRKRWKNMGIGMGIGITINSIFLYALSEW